MNTSSSMRFAFFGSSRFSVYVLEELERAGFIPISVVTTPDKPQGRGLVISPTPVKEWALERKILVHTPGKLDQDFAHKLEKEVSDVFIVASYGKIIPASIFNLPPRGTLNVHPSLLPKYRGATPLQTAILDDVKNAGVTIIKIDEKVDHGPIVTHKEISIAEWPTYEEFEETIARAGGKLLGEILPKWILDKIKSTPQDETQVTYTKKINKEDGEIDLANDPYVNFRKIQAFHEWPTSYFFVEERGKKIRVKVTLASFKDGKLTIERVIPEGKREMKYQDFLKRKS